MKYCQHEFKMADYQDKKQQSQTSSKRTKIYIRFRIRTFYTKIFKEVLKIFQLIVRFGHVHRTANPATEPHKIWQRSLSFSFPFPVSPARFRFPPAQLPRALFFPSPHSPFYRKDERDLCGREGSRSANKSRVGEWVNR